MDSNRADNAVDWQLLIDGFGATKWLKWRRTSSVKRAPKPSQFALDRALFDRTLRHQHPFYAPKCPICVFWDITTHKDHNMRVTEANLMVNISKSAKVLLIGVAVCGPLQHWDSLTSHKSKPQYLKRKWSKDMTEI
eukprot:4629963-Prymnesium_polylepis.1